MSVVWVLGQKCPPRELLLERVFNSTACVFFNIVLPYYIELYIMLPRLLWSFFFRFRFGSSVVLFRKFRYRFSIFYQFFFESLCDIRIQLFFFFGFWGWYSFSYTLKVFFRVSRKIQRSAVREADNRNCVLRSLRSWYRWQDRRGRQTRLKNIERRDNYGKKKNAKIEGPRFLEIETTRVPHSSPASFVFFF